MKKCTECGGNLKIIGTGGYCDTVEAECTNPDCGEIIEVEPDGLDCGGMEWVVAKMMDEGFEDMFDI